MAQDDMVEVTERVFEDDRLVYAPGMRISREEADRLGIGKSEAKKAAAERAERGPTRETASDEGSSETTSKRGGKKKD